MNRLVNDCEKQNRILFSCCPLPILFLLFVFVLNSGFTSNTTTPAEIRLAQDSCRANSLLIESEWQAEKGNFQPAISFGEEAIAIYKTHQLWERAIDVTIDLAYLSDNIDYETKSLYADQAVELAEQQLNDHHILLAGAYRQKAEVYAAFGHVDSSLLYYKKAIPIFEQAKQWEDVAYSKIQEAINYYYQSDLTTAITKLEEGFWDEHELSNDVWSTFYNIKGVFAYEKGDFNQAISITQKALALDMLKAERTPTDSFYIASYLNNLGAFYNIKGDHQRALDYFNRAMNIYQQLPDDFDQELEMNMNIAKVLIAQDEYEAALPFFRQSANDILAQDEPANYTSTLEECYNQIGVAYKRIGQYEQALYYANRALSLPGSQKPTQALMVIGSTLNLQRKPVLAIKTLKEALEQSGQLGLEAIKYQSRINYYLGEAATQQQDYELAINYYQTTLFLQHKDTIAADDLYTNPSLDVNENHIFFLDALQAKAKSLGLLSNTAKDLEASLETYLLCIDWTDSLRQDFILEDNELFWSNRYQEIYEGAIHTAYRLSQLKQDDSYLELAFSLSEKSKAKLLLEAFKTNTSQANSGVPAALIEQERDLSIDVAFYEKSLAQATSRQDTNKINLYQNYLAASRLELSQLKEKLENDYPAFYNLKYDYQLTDIAALRSRLLNEESALLEYFIGSENSYLFVLTQQSLAVLPLPATADLEAAVAEMQAALLRPEQALINAKAAFSSFNNIAYALYEEVLKQADSLLPATIQQLIIIPDGPLHQLSFDVLNTSLAETASTNFGKLPYLLYRYQMQYGYSAEMLLKNQHRQQQLPANIKCLAFAPLYNETPVIAQQIPSTISRNGSVQLAGTSEEIEAIAQYFDGYFDTSPGATKRAFIDQAQDFGVIHLAMHGQADFENTKFGNLIFANTTAEADSAHLLYHYEIANLQLQAQLVVLSACETGLGKYEAGEGVFSLARSFMYAGVPSVIMSLWKVNDLSTSELMPKLYQLLAEGYDKDQALHQAKLQFLEEANLENSHPFYWSGFVVMGDTQPLKQPLFANLIGKSGLFALLLLVLAGGWAYYARQ